MADMQELIARLEAAEAGSRELDCEIAVPVGGFYICTPRYEGAPVAYGYVDEDGAHVEPGHGGAQMVPWYTTSLDAALALADRVLPGHRVAIVSGHAPAAVIAHHKGEHWHLGDELDDSWSCKGSTTALALCIAVLKAVNHAK